MVTKGNEVGVLIPAYKGSSVIATALDSLQKQTYKKLNVYICDDTHPAERDGLEPSRLSLSGQKPGSGGRL